MANKTSNNVIIGNQIETLAAIYLQNNNLELLIKNFRSKTGEIDLICNDQEQKQIVFVEVKYRKSVLFGEGVDYVTYAKQQRIIKTAYNYLYNSFSSIPISYRFDIVSCSGPLDKIKIDWIIGAFY